MIQGAEDVEWDFNTGLARATNGITVKYGGSTLSAKKALVNQNTDCFERPMGRIAPRSLRLIESARARGFAATSQSVSVVP